MYAADPFSLEREQTNPLYEESLYSSSSSMAISEAPTELSMELSFVSGRAEIIRSRQSDHDSGVGGSDELAVSIDNSTDEFTM